PVGEEAPRGHEGVDPGGRAAKGRAGALDDLLEPLVPVLLEEGAALQRPDGRADAHRGQAGRGGVERHEVGPRPLTPEAHAVGIDDLEGATWSFSVLAEAPW